MAAGEADHEQSAAPAAMGQRVAANSLWLIAQPLLLNALSIVSTGYIARKLDVADYGAFNLGFAQIALFAPLCNLGLRGVAVRAIAEQRENARAIVGAVFALRLLFTAAAALLAAAWLALPVYSATTRMIGAAAILNMLFTAGGFIAVDLAMGFERSRLAAQPQMAGGLALTLLSVAALVAGLGLPGFVGAYVLGALIQLLLLFRMAQRELFPIRPAWDPPRMRELLREARPFALMNALSSVTEKPVLDLMILGAALGSGAVGPYSAATGLITRLAIIPYGIGDAMYPAVASSYGQEREQVRAAARRCVLAVLLITLPLAACLSAAAPTVLWILFGSKYLGAVPVLRVVAWLLPLAGLGYVIRECLSAARRQDLVAKLTVAGAALLIALYAIAIPRWGALGAAGATVARELLMLAVWLVPFAATFGQPLRRSEALRLAGALLALAAPLTLLQLHYDHLPAIGACLLAVAAYTVAAWRLELLPAKLLALGRRTQPEPAEQPLLNVDSSSRRLTEKKVVEPPRPAREPRGRRRVPRRLLHAPVMASLGDEVLTAHSVDLSQTGALLRPEGLLPELGDRCYLVMSLPRGVVRAAGMVLRVDPEGHAFAVSFTRINPADRQLLSHQLAEGHTDPRVQVSFASREG